MNEMAVDLAAVESWMDAQGLGSGPIEGVRVLKGGSQNVLLRFARSHAAYVLRRGPVHLRADSNDAMRREMRVLAALRSTSIPHPRLIACCPDESVLGGAAFYLMEEVDGVNATVELADAHRSAEVRRAMGLAAVDVAAALGSVDHAEIGLGDLGRSAGFLERQVPRWLAHLASYDQYGGYSTTSLHVDDVAGWLEEHQPLTFVPGLMHGDLHLANMLFAHDGPQVAAIVDWEMCTVGDPLLDLGWLMATWPGEDWIGLGGALAKAGGLPRPDELADRYARSTTRDLSAITWYEILAALKFAVLVEGTHARACAGLAPLNVGNHLHRMATSALARARSRIATN